MHSCIGLKCIKLPFYFIAFPSPPIALQRIFIILQHTDCIAFWCTHCVVDTLCCTLCGELWCTVWCTLWYKLCGKLCGTHCVVNCGAAGDLSRILSQFTWPAAPQELITITFYNSKMCHHHHHHLLYCH